MQFQDTQTYINLARSFAGECQAGMRYQLIAKQAKEQGYKVLSDTIKTIAKNETQHATVFFEELTKNGAYENINIDAGYPFRMGDLQENLNFAREDENKENLTIYPSFQKIAKQEGFDRIAAIYGFVAEVERQHEVIFKYLSVSLRENGLYISNTEKLWVCSECGHMSTQKEAWHICPLCGHSQGYVDLHLPYEQTEMNVAAQK